MQAAALVLQNVKAKLAVGTQTTLRRANLQAGSTQTPSNTPTEDASSGTFKFAML